MTSDTGKANIEALIALAREAAEANGIDGIAVPDPERPGCYLVYGSHRLLGCVVTEMQAGGYWTRLGDQAAP